MLWRHAQSEANLRSQMPGASDDPLTVQGQEQAKQLGAWLAQQAYYPTATYVSPAVRARQTLDWVEEGFRNYLQVSDQVSDQAVVHPPPQPDPLQPCIDDRLIEIDNGILAGLTWPEAQTLYPELCAALEQSSTWLTIPKAETPTQCRERAIAIAADLQCTARPDDCLWLITHGGFLPYLLSVLLGCDRTWGVQAAPTGLFELEWDSEHWAIADCNRHNTTLWQIHRFNAIGHLQM
ncbi:MAG: histidine phosphatase family protein [Cyanobacteria bacterium P01_H01_bin.121]